MMEAWEVLTFDFTIEIASLSARHGSTVLHPSDVKTSVHAHTQTVVYIFLL